MAPPKRPLHSRTPSAHSIQVTQDVTVTSSSRAESGIDQPSNFESVSIEPSGLNRSNTHKSTGGTGPKVLRRWSTSRRGSISAAQYDDCPKQSTRDLQAIRDQRDGLKALADFLMEVPPPPTNHMAQNMENKSKRRKSFKSSLSGVFGRKKKKNMKDGEAGLIQLPDTAVAATTTSRARYIAISIPETPIDKPRSRPNTSSSKHVKTTVSVLKPVAEASEYSPRNTVIPRYNTRIDDRAEERSSQASEAVLSGEEMRTMRSFYSQQRDSMFNETPPTTRPLSFAKNKQTGRPTSTRYSIFPAVNHSQDSTELREFSGLVATSSEAQSQSVRPKSGPARFSSHQITIPPRHSSLFKVPLPRFDPQGIKGRASVSKDMEENSEAQDLLPEFEMCSLPNSASTFGASQRESMTQLMEKSLVDSSPKRTVSSSTFGTPPRLDNTPNDQISRVIQADPSRPFSSPPIEIQTARDRAFYSLSSTSPSTPSVSYLNRRQLVKARKARDMSIYNYNKQKLIRHTSTSRIYDLELSNTDDEESLATITSAGRTAQANRRGSSHLPIPLCEQLVSDFAGPNHRGNDTDIFYDAPTSPPGLSPMVFLSDFPAVMNTNSGTPSSTILATHKAPIRRTISDATTPPPSSSSDSEFSSPNVTYSYQHPRDSQFPQDSQTPRDSESRYQMTRSPTTLMERRQERRVMRRVAVDELRARELEVRLGRLEDDNLILKSALLGISESVRGMREFVMGDEM